MTQNIPFSIIDWAAIPCTTKAGASGSVSWRDIEFEGLRIRVVEYSAGYLADHWCSKGHIVYCLEGEFISELETGEKFKLDSGMSYVVSDGLSSHRSYTEKGVKLLIIDGGFLQSNKGNQ